MNILSHKITSKNIVSIYSRYHLCRLLRQFKNSSSMCIINDSEVVPPASGASHAGLAPPAPPPRRPAVVGSVVVPYQNVTLSPSSNQFELGVPLESQQQQKMQQVIHVHHHHYQHREQQQLQNNHIQIHEILRFNKFKLEESGWYYGQMTWVQSTALLKATPEGTFLVRDSSDPLFLYSLSVHRGRDEGPTSVRIQFSHGKFRLDAEDKIQHLMPAFNSVVDLVEYYSNTSAKSHVWIDMGGQISPSIWLKSPLLKKVHTLAHSARLTVQRSMKSQQQDLLQQQFKLPFLLTRYLNEYPHKM